MVSTSEHQHDQSSRPLRTDAHQSVIQTTGSTPALRLKELAWEVVAQRLFRLSFHNWYTLRRILLKLFGATIDPTARIRPTTRISHPWNLTIGAHSTIGDHAVLYCLGPVTIGKRCTVSQYAHLCAGSHDYEQIHMPLIKDPIVLEDDVWIAADVFVGPGVVIGTDTIVGARSTVMHSLPEKSICAGDRAKRLAERLVRNA